MYFVMLLLSFTVALYWAINNTTLGNKWVRGLVYAPVLTIVFMILQFIVLGSFIGTISRIDWWGLIQGVVLFQAFLIPVNVYAALRTDE